MTEPLNCINPEYIDEMLLKAGYMQINFNTVLALTAYRKEHYRIIINYEIGRQHINGLYLLSGTTHLMTTMTESQVPIYKYTGIPYNNFMRIVCGPVNEIEMRACNAATEQLLETL